jgi:hypothetical protein
MGNGINGADDLRNRLDAVFRRFIGLNALPQHVVAGSGHRIRRTGQFFARRRRFLFFYDIVKIALDGIRHAVPCKEKNEKKAGRH